MRTLVAATVSALLFLGSGAGVLDAQVRPGYGRPRPRQTPTQTVHGKLKSIGPSGLVLDVEGEEVRLPITRVTEVLLSAKVADPSLVLRPGAFVRTSGILESPTGPVGAGGVTVVLGVPRDRKQLVPDVRISRPQVPGDPPPITLRGRVVAVAPAVVVAAGRYRFPLRLPETPDVHVAIYGPVGLRLASPGDDVTATVRLLPRPGAFVVEQVRIARSSPLTAEDLAGPGLPGAKGKKEGKKKPDDGKKP